MKGDNNLIRLLLFSGFKQVLLAQCLASQYNTKDTFVLLVIHKLLKRVVRIGIIEEKHLSSDVGKHLTNGSSFRCHHICITASCLSVFSVMKASSLGTGSVSEHSSWHIVDKHDVY